MKVVNIKLVKAKDMPDDVIDYCVDHDIPTHYDNGVGFVENDNNAFARWLYQNGYSLAKGGEWVAVLGT
jgi:hypothetical protein